MSSSNRTPFGLAVLDYFNGDTSATLIVYDELGQKHQQSVSLFFRDPTEFPPLENEALDLCRGRILDIGAGVGRHSLALQERGFSVCAVEVVPQCVTIMKRRGIRDSHCSDVLAFQAEPFDTVLCLMNGVGMAGDLAGLQPFLSHLRSLAKTGGQLLIDSTDIREIPELSALVERKAETGQYFGEQQVQIEYKNLKGEPIKELFVESELLTETASRSGWTCQIIRADKGGRYLAQLTAKEASSL
ncbi:MAG: methyltransferase domain-containing protein [Blastocatellia bacterium]